MLLGEDGGGQLGPSGLGHEHLAGLVDPDLLDVRVVEERLKRAHADHPVGHRLGHLPSVVERRHVGDEPTLGVVRDHLVDELADRDPVAVAGVEPTPPDQLADLLFDNLAGGLLRHGHGPSPVVAARSGGHDPAPVVAAACLVARDRRRFRRAWTSRAGNRTAASLASASWAGEPGRASRSACPASSAVSMPCRS